MNRLLKAGKWFMFTALILFGWKDLKAQDGEALFNLNCSVCHKIGEGNFVGPDLKGINDRRNNQWLLSFIKSSQSMISSGDPDAVEVYNSFNKIAMPDQPISDGEINSILTYIGSFGAASAQELTASTSVAEPELTKEDAIMGKELFYGNAPFENKGLSCVSCHNLGAKDLPSGGLLAKDLTKVYDRLGGAIPLMAIIQNSPFPAMATSYNNHPLTEDEVRQLSAFLKEVRTQDIGSPLMAQSYISVFWIGGIAGLLLLLVVIQIMWNKRKVDTIKKEIFKRQIRTY